MPNRRWKWGFSGEMPCFAIFSSGEAGTHLKAKVGQGDLVVAMETGRIAANIRFVQGQTPITTGPRHSGSSYENNNKKNRVF